MPCLLEGAFFVLFLVRTKGAGSLRSTCVSKVAEKVSLWEEKSCQRRKKSGGEDGGKQGLRRKSEPVGGKSLPGAEEIGRGGESFAGKVSLQKEKVSLWEGKVCQGRKIRREERRSPGEEQRPSEEKSKTPRQKPRHLAAPYQASSDRSFKNF